jgi:hypothetical protein
VNSEPTEDHLDRAKSQIRADAKAARERAPLPERIALDSPISGTPAHDATPVSIAHLAQPSGRAFVENAYQMILHRSADPSGLEHQMGVLGRGASKIEILGDMRYSAEGKRNGVRIPGLFPRYFLAKLGRIPVLGALVQWLGAAAALPHMLRYQRATEASLAVRFDETAAELRNAEQRDHDLRAVIDAVLDEQRSAVAAVLDEQRSAVARLEAQQHALRQRIETWEGDLNAVRQMVLSMNHWTFEVRKSIDAIDAATATRRAADDEDIARSVREARRQDAGRAQRLRAWGEALSAHVRADASVLDLGSGADWLAELNARRWRANGIEGNRALHRDFADSGWPVALDDCRALLARTTAQSLDALTVASPARIGAEMALADLLREARRILKAGGCLLIGTEEIGATENAATIETARAAGFAEVRAIQSGDGNAVIALQR